MDLFEDARISFVSALSANEKRLVDSATDPESLLEEVGNLERKHQDESTTRKLIQRINPFIRGVEQYGKAFDVISNAKPEVLSLLWGGARIILHLASEFFEIFEKMTEMLSRVGKLLGMFEIYAKLYPSSQRLKERIVDAYASFLECCLQVKLLLYEAKPRSSLGLKSSSMRILIKSIWKPIKGFFVKVIDKMEEAAEDVRIEADLAEKQEASAARKKADIQTRYERHKDVFDWLDPVNVEANHRRAQSLHEPSTCTWITKSPEFVSWIASPGTGLWLFAKAGAGKTILSSSVVQYLKRRFQPSNTVVVYYYCDYKDPKSQQPQNVLMTILAHLSRLDDKILDFVVAFSENYQKFKTSCSVDVLLQALIDCSALVSRVFVIIDALDEIVDRHELLEGLAKTAHSATNINFFLTSRREYDIELSLGNLRSLSINSADVATDIELYVSSRLDTLIKTRRLKLRDQGLRLEIQDALSSSADGMFQWVKCQLDTICQAISDKAIRESLKNLPEGLDNTYIRIFERLEREFPQEIDTIRRIFFWLTHSIRPMTAFELAEAVYFTSDDGKCDFSSVPTDPMDILRYGSSLLTLTDPPSWMDTTSRCTIGLAHFSVKEFLLSDRIRKSPVQSFYADSVRANHDIVKRSLDYLTMDDFNSGQCLSKRAFKDRLNTYQFLRYAASHWMGHYKMLEDADFDDLHGQVLHFFKHSGLKENVMAWLQASEGAFRYGDYLDRVDAFGRRTDEPKLRRVHSLNPIYHAARYGLRSLTRALVDAGYNPNEYGGEFEYPILAAAFAGKCWEFIGEFIEMGADLHLQSDRGTVAYANATFGTPKDWWVLKRLVTAGANLNATGGKPYEEITVLEAIAEHPSQPVEMLEFLLKNGANPDQMLFRIGQRGGYTSFIAASANGRIAIMEMLLAFGANIDLTVGYLGNALQAAVRNSQFETARFLIEKGVDVNAKGGTFGTAVEAAAWVGNLDFVKLLIDRGANINAEEGIFGCALSAAIAKEHYDVAEFLLQQNAMVNCSPPWTSQRERENIHDLLDLTGPDDLKYHKILPRSTPLNWAVYRRKQMLVARLIGLGAAIDLVTWECSIRYNISTAEHPICMAVVNGDIDMVDFLLSKGANLAIGQYCAFTTSACRGSVEVFSQLTTRLSATEKELGMIHLNALGCCGPGPFAEEVAKSLITMGIEGNENYADDALLSAVRKDSESAVRLLLSLGANANVSFRSWRRETSLIFNVPVLMLAISSRKLALVDMLLDAGADVNVGCYGFGTPLSTAVLQGSTESLIKFLARGASVSQGVPQFLNRRIYPCGNLLHLAIQSGELDIVQILVGHGADVSERCELCPTALFCSISEENLPMMKTLVDFGADVDERDIYGCSLLQRAQDLHLDDFVKELLDLGANSRALESHLLSYVQNSVKRLSHELRKDKRESQPEEINRQLFLMLGKCLFRGNDVQNAFIAAEQSTLTGSWESPCGLCRRGRREDAESDAKTRLRIVQENTIHHFCKLGDPTGICENGCVKAHWQFLKDSDNYDDHEFLRFPRPWLKDAPKGQVVLTKNTYLPIDDWLETLGSWNYRFLDDSKILKRSDFGVWYE